MTKIVVNTHEAKSQLSSLIRRAADGAEVIVARAGEPVAKIVPWPPEKPVRSLGAWSGRVAYSSDMVSSDPELVQLFEESVQRSLE